MLLRNSKILRICEIERIPFIPERKLSELEPVEEKYLCEFVNVFVTIIHEMMKRKKIILTNSELNNFENIVVSKPRLKSIRHKLSKLFKELDQRKVSFEDYFRFTFLFFQSHQFTEFKYFLTARILSVKIRDIFFYLIDSVDNQIIKEINHFFSVFDNFFGCYSASIYKENIKKIVNVISHLNFADDYAGNNIKKYLDLWKQYIERYYNFGDVKYKIGQSYSYIISTSFVPQESTLKLLAESKTQVIQEKKIPENLLELKEYFGFDPRVSYNNSGFGKIKEFPRKFILHKGHEIGMISVIFPDGSYKINGKYYSSLSDSSKVFFMKSL